MERYYREKNDTFLRFGVGNSDDFPAHIHEDVELMGIKSGTHIAYSDGKRYELKAGDIFLACSNQVHSFEKSLDSGQHYTVIIKPSLLGQWGTILSENVPVVPVWHGALDAPAWRLLDICYEEYRSHGEQETLYTLLAALAGMLCRELDFQRELPSAQQSIRGILQYCAVHFREDISVKTMSEALFLSQSHISHIFGSKLKISFPDYINSLRVAEAAKLLQQDGCSVSEAASLAGFTTVRTFNRAFYKRYGVTPTQYRKQG